jgi:hypothetical protein
VWRKGGCARDRRRDPRKAVHWVGRAQVPGSLEQSLCECTIADVSHAGAALVFGEGVHVVVGQTLIITVERIGSTPVALELRGTVRNVSASAADTGVRMGVDVSFDGPTAQRIAKTLFAV